jgi:hypothetical protein
MAAFGDVTLGYKEKTIKGTLAHGIPSMYTRTFTFQTQVSDTAAGPITVTGLTLPPGAYVLGGSIKPTKTSDGTILSTGSTTLAFAAVSTASTIVFSAATAYASELVLTNSIPLAVLSTATANATVTVTTAAATLPAYAMTFYVTLFLGGVTSEVSEFSTYST